MMEKQLDIFSADSDNPEYAAFVEKFKPKKTTDDCYTPPLVYDTILSWVREEYGISESTRIVRPFYPGGDYLSEDYTGDCVVVDNPPFSILGEIEQTYLAHGVRFFLFSPTLTIFKPYNGMTHIVTDGRITYANGAVVNTSFVTNLGDVNVVVRTAPTLANRIKEADKKSRQEAKQKNPLPKYEYNQNTVTIKSVLTLSRAGVEYSLNRKDAMFISKLDSQKEHGKQIFGGGYLISEKAAAEKATAEKATAEKAAAIVWTLSDREKEIIANLGK